MPDTLLQKLHDILRSDYFVPGAPIVLQENDSGPRTVIKKTGIAYAFQLDKGDAQEFLPFFRKRYPGIGLFQRPDYLLFYPHNNVLFVFICELKSNNTTRAIKQVEAGFLLAEYFVKTAIRLLNYRSPIIEYRGIIFSQRQRPSKGTTKPNRQIKYAPPSAAGLKYQHVQIGEDFHLNAWSV